MVKTFDAGTMLFLETDTPAETTRVGLLKSWGGSITEVSLNGTNYVNSDDPGRQIQTSLWDGNADYTTSWGYNPIEAGDHLFQGSPLLAHALLPDSLYTKTQPIQWAPENFGGGPENPVTGDAYIEKWISVVPGYNRVFKVHYKITHFGTDSHAQNLQELPVAYVNPNIPHFLYYSGKAPWTHGALTAFDVQGPCCDHVHTPERWGAYVDATNTGLALYTPGQFPHSQVFNADSTLQLTPLCPFSWGPGTVLEFDTYILAGPVDESREAIYALHSQESRPSPLPPWGALDSPANGDILRGDANAAGWAWGLSRVASITVFLDDSEVASANLGISRPDVTSLFPDAPTDTGFEASVDTTQFSNGIHSLVVKATNVSGAVTIFPTVQVTISN
jgi:N-acetylmuramoyl-L-alanine amidase